MDISIFSHYEHTLYKQFLLRGNYFRPSARVIIGHGTRILVVLIVMENIDRFVMVTPVGMFHIKKI
jgi:hypothetical protein